MSASSTEPRPYAVDNGWLPTPGQLSTGVPLGARTSTLVSDTRRAIADILAGRDERLLVICGPCSIHDPAAALDYARRLRIMTGRLTDDLLVVMRCYTEQARPARGLRIPIGFTNRFDGALEPAVNAAAVAAEAQDVVTLNASGMPTHRTAPGNPSPHVVLCGGDNGPNHHTAQIAAAARLAAGRGLVGRVVVDGSHDNSGNDPARQRAVLAELTDLVRDPEQPIAGVMIESNIIAGRQDIDLTHPHPLTWGQSITDACISLDETRPILRDLAAAVRVRRQCLHAEVSKRRLPRCRASADSSTGPVGGSPHSTVDFHVEDDRSGLACGS